jgi:hypothetical protein
MRVRKRSRVAALAASLLRANRGGAPPIFLAAMLTLSILAGGAACGNGEEDRTPMSSPDLSAAEIVDSSAGAMESLDSFHLGLSHKGGGTPAAWGLEVTKVACDVTRPAAIKGTIEAEVMNSFVELGIVTVGNITCMTHPLTGEWEEISRNFNAAGMFAAETNVSAMLKNMSDLSRQGDEKVAGVSCHHVRGVTTSDKLHLLVLLLRLTPVEGAKIDTDMWIGMDDGLLRRIRFEGQVTADEKAGIVRTMTFSRFNQEVEIGLPEVKP